MSFYLTGSFNTWRADDPNYRFQEVLDSYGGQRPELTLSQGSYFLLTNFPQKRIHFKIVENGSWEKQWSINVFDKIDRYHFEMRNGLKAFYIICRGAGTPPHAEYDYPGGRMRWDFHPESRTLTIHRDFHREAGVRVQPWEWFDCGEGIGFQTYVGLPYGYARDGTDCCSTSLVLDGRGLLYGEDSNFNVWNEPHRQWLRPLDTLTRHGIIMPTVAIAIAPPTKGNQLLRNAAYLMTHSDVHRRFTETICTCLLPKVEQTFGVCRSPDLRYLIGHSNGADIALTLVTRYAHLFGGVVAHSPGNASLALKLPTAARSRVRMAVSYASEDLSPAFVVPTASVKAPLEKAGIQHMLQYIPDAAHDPVSLYQHLHPAFAYVMR